VKEVALAAALAREQWPRMDEVEAGEEGEVRGYPSLAAIEPDLSVSWAGKRRERERAPYAGSGALALGKHHSPPESETKWLFP